MSTTIIINPSEEDIQDIRNGLIEHNSPYLKGLRQFEVANFRYKENGKKYAGVTGKIWGNWLLIQYLWVDKNEKGKGIGSTILSELELYAKQQGCHSCLLDTFSFQAKPFYEKHGYILQMTMENFPADAQRYYLIKQL